MKYLKKVTTNFDSFVPTDTPAVIWNGGEIGTSACKCKIFPKLEMEFVDLGLSVQWAKWNLGASKDTEIGNLYAWAETSPKSEYTWNNYKYGTIDNLIKYNASDKLTELLAEDDPANVQNSQWRIPKPTEINELINNTTQAEVIKNGVTGTEFTSTRNGAKIFIPSKQFTYDGTFEAYGALFWYSQLNTAYNYATAWFLACTNEGVNKLAVNGDRYWGLFIRPVHSVN